MLEKKELNTLISLSIPPGLLEDFDEVAKEYSFSRAELMRNMMRETVEKYKSKMKATARKIKASRR